MRLGIDFGTTHTVTAVVDRGNYPVVAYEWGDAVPSLAAVRHADGLVRYGNDAAAVARDPGWTVLRSFKRLLADAGPQTRIEVGGHSLLLADLLAGHFSHLRQEIVSRSNAGAREGEPLEVAVSVPAMLAAVKAGVPKLVHTPHFQWMTDADAQVARDAGVQVLSCAGFGAPVFGVFNKDNVGTFRDGGKWPDTIIDGEGRGREAGYKPVNGRTFLDNGVVYGFGTDTGYLPLAGLSQELRVLNLMFSPVDLVKVMGPNSAAWIDMGKDLGTLEVGKLADLVVLDADPSVDIRNSDRVVKVMIGGRLYDAATLNEEVTGTRRRKPYFWEQ